MCWRVESRVQCCDLGLASLWECVFCCGRRMGIAVNELGRAPFHVPAILSATEPGLGRDGRVGQEEWDGTDSHRSPIPCAGGGTDVFLAAPPVAGCARDGVRDQRWRSVLVALLFTPVPHRAPAGGHCFSALIVRARATHTGRCRGAFLSVSILTSHNGEIIGAATRFAPNG